jgi:putative hydrolase of the HAD superfamily
MSIPSSLSALLIDLDNTLIDRDVAFASWLQTLPVLTHRDRQALIQTDAGGHGSRARLFAQLRQKLHVTLETARQIFEKGVLAHLTLKPGAETLLASFSGPKVIVTNGSSRLQRAKLEAVRLQPFIDAVIVSEELGHRKPHPALYRAALASVSAKPDQALMIGDHPVHDIAGAAQEGISGVLLRTRWFDPPKGMMHIESLAELQLP